MQSLLITDGLGQGGSYLADRFAENYDVTVLDNRTYQAGKKAAIDAALFLPHLCMLFPGAHNPGHPPACGK
jgi:nucleoside-diphosphate-sugar epimerase